MVIDVHEVLYIKTHANSKTMKAKSWLHLYNNLKDEGFPLCLAVLDISVYIHLNNLEHIWCFHFISSW